MNEKEKFLYALPRNCNRQKYLEVANILSIPAKTAQGYITAFIKLNLIHRESQDNFLNTLLEEAQDFKEIFGRISPLGFPSKDSTRPLKIYTTGQSKDE